VLGIEMFGGRMLDLFMKQILVYRVESIRSFSTKNVNAVTNWRQLIPRAPRRHKQSKKPTTKTTHSVVVPKNKSSPSIQTLESTSGPAQRKIVSNEVLKSTFSKATELSSSEKPKKLPIFKSPSYKKTIMGTAHREQVKETSAEDIKSTVDVSYPNPAHTRRVESGYEATADDANSEKEETDFSKWKFCSASFLGCTPGEVTQRVKELSKAGFCNEHIDLLLKRLPPSLKINSKMIYQNVNNFIKWNIPWKQFVDTNPEILLMEPSQVWYVILSHIFYW